MKRKDIVSLIIFCLITFFVNQSALPTDIMESRNIITAREMVSDGNWLVPTMNGELRLEKPPLPTWIAGGIEEVCPDSLAAQRTAAGIMGCIWTLYLFLLVRYVSRRDDLPLATTIVFLTCYNVVLMGRSATWDIYCHAFMMAAIYYLTRALYSQRDDRKAHTARWFILSGLFMGLSFLSKGPVSFYALLLPYIITMVLLPHPMMKGKWKWFVTMIVVMLVVGSWWYIYLLTAHPAEVEAVIHKESGNWSNHNVRPWYYYWRFFLEMGVWAVLMLAALAVPYWKRHISVKRDYLLAITWAIASLVLLSLMPEKKTRYLLPSLAPCSVVVACLLVHFRQGRQMDTFSRWLYRCNGVLVSLIVLAAPVFVWKFAVANGMITTFQGAVVTFLMVAIAVWLLLTTFKWQPISFAGGIAVLFAIVEIFLLGPVGDAFGNPDEHSISAVQTDKRVENIPFYYNEKEELRIELVYAAHRKILPMNLSNADSVRAALPCAIVSRGWASEELPASILNTVDTVSIGTFDDNKHPRKDRHYSTLFLNHVTLLKAAKGNNKKVKAEEAINKK